MDLIAQAASAADAVPAWVGTLSSSAVMGVLVYYLVTTAIPRMQDKFHEALEKERESREKMVERTFEEHRGAIKSLIERDEKKHDQVMARLDQLPGMLRSQV